MLTRVLLIGFLASVFLSIFVYGYLLFRFACRRPHSPEKDLEKTFARHTYENCRQEAKEGVRWFLSQNPMNASTVSYDGLSLTGYYLPNPRNRGTLILFHGWRGSALSDFGCVLKFYYSLGFHLLMVEQRGQNTSSGTWMTYGVKERRDVHTWVEWVNARSNASLPIILGGVSMGASSVMMSLAWPFPSNVKGVISDCGFTSPYEIIYDVLHKNCKLPTRGSVWLVSCYAKLIAKFNIKECSATDILRTTDLPILFIHGQSDTFVPYDMGVRNFEACQSSYKQFLGVPNAKHTMSYATDREAYTRTVSSFIDHILND